MIIREYHNFQKCPSYSRRLQIYTEGKLKNCKLAIVETGQIRYDIGKGIDFEGMIYMLALPADNICQRIIDLRNGTGKSQKEVADALGITASVLSRLERGETKFISHDLIIALAEYYNVTTDYLLCVSDVRIRKNVELEELGLSNKALILLLQGRIDTKMLNQMIEHPYFPLLLDTANAYFTDAHEAGFATRNDIIDLGTSNIKDFIEAHPEQKVEGNHDIRKLNAEKINGTDADYEKIKSIFLSMLKDIKKKMKKPENDITSEKLRTQIKQIHKEATATKKKNKLDENKMAEITASMLSQAQFDEEERKMFQDLAVHVLKRTSQH